MELAKDYTNELSEDIKEKWDFASTLCQSRINKLSEISYFFDFLNDYQDFDLALFENKKNKLDKAGSLEILKDMYNILKSENDWSVERLNQIIQDYATEKEMKIGKAMWPVRIGVTGQTVTPGGGAEMLYLLGKEKSMERLEKCIQRLS